MMSYGKFSKIYTERRFLGKVSRVAKAAGLKVIYAALLLYYVLQEPALPPKAKATIIGALGYFVFPLDAIPDVLVGVGYADDIGVLLLALAAVTIYINDGVKEKARKKLGDWFGDYDSKEVEAIEKEIIGEEEVLPPG